ncbi:MAG: hypothetical protein V1808_00020, partial [Candidatus Daviesbacteria bacterium]
SKESSLTQIEKGLVDDKNKPTVNGQTHHGEYGTHIELERLKYRKPQKVGKASVEFFSEVSID